MFTSTASIQSKTSFVIQEYTHRILTKLKLKSDPTYYTLLDCQRTMCSTMTSYHELTRLEDQIAAYDSYAFALARSTAITEQISNEIDVYPPVSEFNKTTQKYYQNLVYESAKKREHLNKIQLLD